MKKILLAAIAASLLFPGLALAMKPDDTSALEQIPSPEYLEYYKVLEEKGNSLWGQRLITKEEMKAKLAEKKAAKKDEIAAKKDEKKTVKSDKSAEKQGIKDDKKLEKIATPEHIKFFEGIRQVGSSLWGFVKESWAYGLGRLTKDGAACVAAATAARDTAVRAAMVANDASLLAAFDARSACQQAAFTKDTAKEMAGALVKCNDSYQASRKEAWKHLVSDRDVAWTKYREDLKKCGEVNNVTLKEAESDTQDVIESLDDETLDEISEDIGD